MKIISICILLLIFSSTSYSQQTNPPQALSKPDYFQKSKHQNTTAWILFGGGAVLYVAGAIAYQHGNAGLFLFGAGLLAQASSVPFFIFSGINKRNARRAAMSFKIERNQDIKKTAINVLFYPAMSVKLNL